MMQALTQALFTPDMNDGRHVLVFGANEAGRHGAGAAREALYHWGAMYGQGFGRQGMSYGIPTKDTRMNTLPIPKIKAYVCLFLDYAKSREGMTFLVTAIGTGLAGLSAEDIAPLFADAPDNCVLPEGWKNYGIEKH